MTLFFLAFSAFILIVSMPIVLKTRREIEMMRRAGQVGCEILQKMREAAVPGRHDLRAGRPGRAASWNKVGAIGLSKNYPTYKPGEGFPGRHLHQRQRGSRSRHPRHRGSSRKATSSRSTWRCRSTAIVPTPRPPSRSARSARSAEAAGCHQGNAGLAINNMKPGRKWSDIARLMQYHVEKQRLSAWSASSSATASAGACTKTRRCRISSPPSSCAATLSSGRA